MVKVESNRIEFKQGLTDGLEKEVIAFLNYREGDIRYIGVEKSGEIVGVPDSDGDMFKIRDCLKNNICPSCLGLFDIVLEESDGKEVTKVVVASGSEKPYYLKKYGMSERGAFIRVGTASEPMPIKMIETLFSKRIRCSIGKIRSTKQNFKFTQLKIYYEGVGKKN